MGFESESRLQVTQGCNGISLSGEARIAKADDVETEIHRDIVRMLVLSTRFVRAKRRHLRFNAMTKKSNDLRRISTEF
jgi:hypothetical protein